MEWMDVESRVLVERAALVDCQEAWPVYIKDRAGRWHRVEAELHAAPTPAEVGLDQPEEERLHPLERRLGLYTQQEICQFELATVLPHAREQVVGLLVHGLCASTGACKEEDGASQGALILEPLRKQVGRVVQQLEPLWWTSIVHA